MFVLIDTCKEVKVGEPVVVRSDNMGGIGAYAISGEKIGMLTGAQPDGCVDYWAIAGSLYDNRVLGTVAIKCGSSVFLSTDSRLLARATAPKSVTRVVKEGYGMLVASK